VTGLALGIVITLTTDVPSRPKVGLVPGALAGCSRGVTGHSVAAFISCDGR
jgi:hypothetical protein